MKTFVLALAMLSFACTTAVVPQAESIRTTNKKEHVADCKILGTVDAHPPYIYPGDHLKQLKNKAAPLGADTVFVTNSVGTITGVAYKCNPDPAP